MKTRIRQFHVGGRSGGTDFHDLNLFNCRDAVINFVKIDQGTTAANPLYAETMSLKQYNYPANMKHDDAPSAFYAFRQSDISNGTIAHEEMSGGTCTVAPNNGMISGNLIAGRYAGLYGMITSNGTVTDAAGHTFLEAAENAAQSWSFEAVVYRVAGSASATILLETNAAVTNYLQILILASGAVQISHSGAAAFTSAAGVVPIAQGTHIGLTYNVATAQVQLYINGAATGAATAYTRTTYPGGSVVIGSGGQNQHYVAFVATYQNGLLVASDFLRHFNELFIDNIVSSYVAYPATVSYGGTITCVYSNEMVPGADTASGTVRMPMAAWCRIVLQSGVWHAELITNEYEEGDV